MYWQPEISPDHEPYDVLIHKGEITDDNRDGRIVPYKIYYPVLDDAHEKVPVIIWSHGLGGSRDGAAFLNRFIAANGYIVVNVQHHGTDSSLWEGKPGHPWDVIRKAHIPRSATLNRFYDIPFILNMLPEIFAQKPALLAIADTDNLGMSGHSFGALTTQVMAGQLFPDADDYLQSYDEERFKAGILYSFVPMGHLTDEAPEKLYGPMQIPLFFMTGTKDDSPIEGFDYTYRMAVYDDAGCSEKYLLVLDEGDHMVFAGSRGKLANNPKRDEHEAQIKMCSLAFWDFYLKGNKAAKDWLTSEISKISAGSIAGE